MSGRTATGGGNHLGQSQLDSMAAECKGNHIDRKNKLIDAHFSGADELGQIDSIEKSNQSGEKTGTGEDESSRKERMGFASVLMCFYIGTAGTGGGKILIVLFLKQVHK